MDTEYCDGCGLLHDFGEDESCGGCELIAEKKLLQSQLKERDARIEILTKGLSDYGWELIDEENEHYGYSRRKYGEAARAIIRKLKSQDEK